MRNFSISGFLSRLLVPAVLLPVFASCGGSVKIDGTVKDAPSSEIVVKLLDVNKFNVLDTVSTDAGGHFSYKMDIEKGQPQFVYLFYRDTRIASLLLEKGDRVRVDSDTTGVFTVSGSDESLKLAQVEKDFSEFSTSFTALAARLDAADPASDEASELRREMGRSYTEYYRSRVKYVMENPYSLTVVPVFYQTIGSLPVFGQDTDAIHFRNISDSLQTVYPDSKYVRALKSEADRRSKLLELRVRLQGAEQVNFPDIELSDVNARKVKLSEVDSKVVMLHFWTSTDAMQKMFNLDVLKPVYEDYHNKGFEIYQVALDTDKAGWARTVKDQGLEWINVCDVLGANSAAARMYNVQTLPVSFFLCDGELVDAQVSDASSLRRLLDRLLK